MLWLMSFYSVLIIVVYFLIQVFRVIAEVFISVSAAAVEDAKNCPAAHTDTLDRMRAIVKQIQQGLSSDVVQGAFSYLSADQQTALTAI